MSPKKVQTKAVPKEEYRDWWRKALDRRGAMEREEAAGAHDPALLLAVQGGELLLRRGVGSFQSLGVPDSKDAAFLASRLSKLTGLPID
jgi:hypothetical protein